MGDLENVSDAIEKLLDMTSTSLEYISKVLSGESQGDPKIGRFLLDTLSAVPKVRAASTHTHTHTHTCKLTSLAPSFPTD